MKPCWKFPRLLLLAAMLLPAPAWSATHVVGVLAWRGVDKARRDWSPTIRALDAALPRETFVLAPLKTLKGLEEAVRTGKVDFFITNPGHYVTLEQRYGAARLATLETVMTGKPGAAIGAVIFARAGNPAIRSLKDLRGRTFLAASPEAFGGFQIAWGVLHDAGINPQRDMGALVYKGLPLDKIVMAVRDGRGDAGTVRACLLESMAAEGRIALKDFRILHPRKVAGFDCALSSPLYPDWPFAKTMETSRALAKRVAIALLALKGENVRHWTIPLSYQPVHELFKKLRIGPYQVNLGNVLLETLSRNWGWFAFAGVLLLLAILHVSRVEYLVHARTRALKESQQKARLRLAELAHVSRQVTLGELASGLAHEISQPLGAIGNYAAGCRRALASGADPSVLQKPLREISRQAEHAGRILKRIRGFMSAPQQKRVAADINAILADALDLLCAGIRAAGVRVITRYAQDLPPVPADAVAIGQVALNIIRNALEAMSANPPGAPRQLTIATSRDGAMVRVAISDTGPGLPEEEIEPMFEPFQTSREKGMGLGLSISRSIVHNHGGRIGAAANETGKGLTVVFSLPLKEESA